MANPHYLVTGTPKVDSFDVKVGPTFSSPALSDHPFAPWGPVTKFYVRFSIHPVRQFCFDAPRRPEHHALPAVQFGVVLARAYEGRANLCIWEGQIVDAVLRAPGISPNAAKLIARAIYDRVESTPRTTLTRQVDVEMDVVTPYFVQGDHRLDMVSVPVQSRGFIMARERADCGVCSEPLVKELVVRRAECSHSFHCECLSGLVQSGSRICPICRAEFKSSQDDDVNRTRIQRQRKRFQGSCGCDPTHLFIHRRERQGCRRDGFHEQYNMLVLSYVASSSNSKLPNLPHLAANKRCRC